ncbi:MerR family transcriptional regulator [Candidatus Poriferisodalis sp.]|uniref:MerR family transcriptional regulator n=1 Tax=Candidatus Poriferisodalis sp. TaxID=3101277 RepID=UPI003D10F147
MSIGEVVTLLRPEFSDLTDSKIRFLEDRQLISPARTESGYRSFGPHDIEVLRWILTRQRDQYLPLSIIGERIDRGEHLADIWGIGTGDAAAAGRTVAAGPTGQLDDDTGEGPPGAQAPHDDEGPADDGSADDVGRLAPEDAATAQKPPWSVTDVDDELTYSAEELSAASGLSLPEIKELTGYGLLVRIDDADPGHSQLARGTAVQTSMALGPPEPRYSAAALLVARIAREFSTYGLQARHLRVMRNAAARDAATFEQGIQPILHAGGAEARSDVRRSLERLVALCERLRAQVISDALGDYWRS